MDRSPFGRIARPSRTPRRPLVPRETAVRPATIVGVDTRTAGFLGETERGPTVPRLVTSADAFAAHYGEAIEGSCVAEAVDGFFENGGDRCYVGRVTAADETAHATLADDDGNPALGVAAVGPGAWGTRVAVTVANALSGKPDEFSLVIRYWEEAPETVDGSRQDDPRVALGEPTVEETYDALATGPDAPTRLEPRINGGSTLVDVERADDGAPRRPADGTTFLAGPSGTASPPPRAAYRGRTSAGDPTGLAAFADLDEVALVCAPASARVAGLARVVETHCRTMGDRFAILDSPRDAGPVQSISPPVDSRYAAFYYPWIVVDGPSGSSSVVPPSGHLAGIYARTDATRGVHRAPANEPIDGAQDVQVDVTAADQDVLNPRGVNCIRKFPDRGVRVWGARTTSDEQQWRYVSVSRLVMYLRESIGEGLRRLAADPDDERVWARVRDAIRDFLTDAWRAGALRGSKPEDAFFVTCDRSTMTQADIDQGRLVVRVGVAPVTPAEFTVFEVTQQAVSAGDG